MKDVTGTGQVTWIAHAADLELARLCAAGDERAWERFVREYRPLLYRAADALDRSGGAREIADSLYADLYGVNDDAAASGSRCSATFEGRSSLATWLRAVLAQRYVDRLRSASAALEPLPDEEVRAGAERASHRIRDRARYVGAGARRPSERADRPAPRARSASPRLLLRAGADARRDRPRRERERSDGVAPARADAARHPPTRSSASCTTRRSLTDDQIAACFASVADDPGPLDLKQVIYE